MALKIAVLDDYADVARRYADWPQGDDVTVFHRTMTDPAELAATLAPFDVLCVMRERTPLDGALIRGPRWGGDLSSVLAYARAPRRDTRDLPAAGSLNGPTPCLESVLQLRAAMLDTFSQEGAGL